MNARELYEQFDEWLRAKYAEVCVEWDKSSHPEVRTRYDELLARICLQRMWARTKADALK